MAFLFRVQFEVRQPEAQTGWTSQGGSFFLSSRASYGGAPTVPIDRTDFGYANRTDRYRRGPRTVLVLAASQHPADLLVPLSNNVSLGAGEQIQILGAAPVQVGSEGPAVIGAAAAAVWVAEFQTRKPNPAPLPPGGGPLNLLTKPPRKALVCAATSAAVPGVLASNIGLAGGEVLDVLNVQQFVEGAEGGAVWF